MLSQDTSFPQVGSYALLIDRDRPIEQQSAELVRVQYRSPCDAGNTPIVTVAFPLRCGAEGTKRVPLAELIHAAPLTSAESRDMGELRRELAGLDGKVGGDGPSGKRVRGRKAKSERYQALRSRAIWSPHFERLLVRARSLEDAKRRAA